jgi:hypothetical protein
LSRFDGMIYFYQRMHGLTWPKLVELGGPPEMEGQFLTLEPIYHV